MRLWSSVVDGVNSVRTSVNYVRTSVSNGVYWVTDNTTLAQIATGIAQVTTVGVKFTLNTSIQLLEQALALPKAVHALVYKPKSRKILDSMAYIAVYDILPAVS